VSRYTVNKAMREIALQRPAQMAFAADPAAFLQGRDLSAEEMQALKTIDYATLYKMGAHPMLIVQFVMTLRRGDVRELAKEWNEKIAPLGRPDFST
jgi:Aromatic-ring-opening dioxygenase LigAB, LigA subunit